MNEFITYGILAIVLLKLELLYFRFADRLNIIDKPNERSSHSTIVLRGGGVVSFPFFMYKKLARNTLCPMQQSLDKVAR